MYDLFNPAPSNAIAAEEQRNQKIMNDISMIQGLTYIPNFIDKLEVKKFHQRFDISQTFSIGYDLVL